MSIGGIEVIGEIVVDVGIVGQKRIVEFDGV